MKIAFVIPWYGKDIAGGAESECRKTALHLKKAGINVGILTTCVRDSYSNWNENYHKEGEEIIEGMIVRRFKVRKRDTKRFDAINYKLMNTDMRRLKMLQLYEPEISPISRDEEDVFINEMINSPDLYNYISQTQKDYDFFIFIPYMFGTTYFGSKACKEKAILIPCLHDEGYAYMSIYREMFQKARGIVFLSMAEQELKKRLYGDSLNGILLGGGVDAEFECDGQRFLKKYSIEPPFILYAGRKDTGKNTPLLIDYFCRYKSKNENSKLKLILIGSGKICIPKGYSRYIFDLGFIESQDKYDAYKAALCLCQPSINESFSLVVMESWCAGTPVLVHAGCEVTREFCIESNGGLYFSNYAEFTEAVDFLMNNSTIREGMGENGHLFVKKNFSWDVIITKLITTLEAWKKNECRSSPAHAQS